MVLELLDRGMEVKEALGRRSREVLDANRLLVEDPDVLRDGSARVREPDCLAFSEGREMEVLMSLKTLNVRDFGRRLLLMG